MKTLRQHIATGVVLAGLLINAICRAGDLYHDFTDSQGRIIKGQLMEFDALRGRVVIQREDGKACSAPLHVFCEADQSHIRQWGVEHDFKDLLEIEVALRTFKKPQAGFEGNYNPEYIKCLGYEVKLGNRSDTRFGPVEIEYCLFYHQGERNRGSIVFSEGVQYGEFKINELGPNGSEVLTTAAVLVYDEGGPVTIFGRSGGAKGEVIGCWVRVHTTLPSGARLSKEFQSPANLAHYKMWAASSISAGLNMQTGGRRIQYRSLDPVALPPVHRLTME